MPRVDFNPKGPVLGDILPPARLCHLNLPKQFQMREAKLRGGQSSFKPPHMQMIPTHTSYFPGCIGGVLAQEGL